MLAAPLHDFRLIVRNKFLKLFLALLFITGFWLLFTPSIFAQTNSQTNYSEPINTQYLSPQSPHTASMAIYNFGHAMSCILIGQSPTGPCLEYKLYTDATGAIKSVPVLNNVNTSNGLLGLSMSMVGEVIATPPIRSSEFIANFGEQLGIKSAHAQV